MKKQLTAVLFLLLAALALAGCGKKLTSPPRPRRSWENGPMTMSPNPRP